MKEKLILKSYIVFSIFYLLIVLFQQEEIAWYLKPFLIPFLFLAVYFSEKFNSKKVLLMALFFSWIGDVVLLFSDHGELYFIAGLLAFLISHLIYILLFTKQLNSRNIKNISAFWMGIGFIILYFSILIFTLFPKLGTLKIPVLLYATVITTMLYFAFKGSLKWTEKFGDLILVGAIFFVGSDSILAFDKFYSPIPFNSFLIMSTYCIAQYFIVSGILKLNQKNYNNLK
jgi:uncharacterized membrane protein YhhN